MDINPGVLSRALRNDLAGYCMFDDSGLPELPDPYDTPIRVASYQLATSFFKKLEDGCEGLEDAAYEKFLNINRRCQEFEVKPNTSLDEMLLGDFRNFFAGFFSKAIDRDRCWWSLDECLVRGRTGPGASLGATYCDFYHKMFASRMTYTRPSLYRHYVDSLYVQPRRQHAELVRATQFGKEEVRASRLTFVPKNVNELRTICVEPNLNMYYQLGLGAMIEDELRMQFGVDLSTQQFKNRELARLGSIDDSYATIDLSSASDSISLKLMQWLEADRFAPFSLLRTSHTRNGMSGDEVELHMISTMGNGFTFPLETLIFVCMVMSVFLSFGKPPGLYREDWGVFGDDIIVPSYMYNRMCRLLTLTGFTVNTDKSYAVGPFKESCGGDFYLGHGVRGVYLKTLRTRAALYSAINRLIRWSLNWEVELHETLGLLLREVPLIFVPLHESDDSGIKVPLWVMGDLIPRDQNGSYLYQAWAPILPRIRVNTQKMTIRSSKGKKHFFNIEGIHLSWLAGHIRAGMIGARPKSSRYRREGRVSPCWDYTLNHEYLLPRSSGRTSDILWALALRNEERKPRGSDLVVRFVTID